MKKTEKPSTTNLDSAATELLRSLYANPKLTVDDIRALLQKGGQKKDGKEGVESFIRYRQEPVGIREFIESPEFMDKGDTVWEKILLDLEECNNGTYTEAVLTGPIGTGKTTFALYTQAYQLYLLSCYREPHKTFGLDPASEIVIIFQSLNRDLAREVDYNRFRDMIAKAPYFEANFQFRKDFEGVMKFPDRIEVKPVTGQETSALGHNVIGGIIDEINFMAVVKNSLKTKDGTIYDQAVSNYNSISRRRQSRFLSQGFLPGMLCLVSSRNYPGQFTDQKEEEAKTNPQIFVYDRKSWELRPDNYSKTFFPVFIGDVTRKPKMLTDKEAKKIRKLAKEKDEDPLIMEIPDNFIYDFERDIMGALRDIAGVSTSAMHPYITNREKIAKAFGQHLSILSLESVDFSLERLHIYPQRIIHKERKRYVHIDLAITGDCAGIACAYVPYFTKVNRSEQGAEIFPAFRFDFILQIRPPHGGEISFSAIRDIIYRLSSAGLPVKWVSLDSFQSVDTLQILHTKGYMTGKVSADVNPIVYDVLKQGILDERVMAPTHDTALKELSTLEKVIQTHKIDHPPGGSKDCADAMAGCAYGLFMRREVWTDHSINAREMEGALKEFMDYKHRV